MFHPSTSTTRELSAQKPRCALRAVESFKQRAIHRAAECGLAGRMVGARCTLEGDAALGLNDALIGLHMVAPQIGRFDFKRNGILAAGIVQSHLAMRVAAHLNCRHAIKH